MGLISDISAIKKVEQIKKWWQSIHFGLVYYKHDNKSS